MTGPAPHPHPSSPEAAAKPPDEATMFSDTGFVEFLDSQNLDLSAASTEDKAKCYQAFKHKNELFEAVTKVLEKDMNIAGAGASPEAKKRSVADKAISLAVNKHLEALIVSDPGKIVAMLEVVKEHNTLDIALAAEQKKRRVEAVKIELDREDLEKRKAAYIKRQTEPNTDKTPLARAGAWLKDRLLGVRKELETVQDELDQRQQKLDSLPDFSAPQARLGRLREQLLGDHKLQELVYNSVAQQTGELFGIEPNKVTLEQLAVRLDSWESMKELTDSGANIDFVNTTRQGIRGTGATLEDVSRHVRGEYLAKIKAAIIDEFEKATPSLSEAYKKLRAFMEEGKAVGPYRNKKPREILINILEEMVTSGEINRLPAGKRALFHQVLRKAQGA